MKAKRLPQEGIVLEVIENLHEVIWAKIASGVKKFIKGFIEDLLTEEVTADGLAPDPTNGAVNARGIGTAIISGTCSPGSAWWKIFGCPECAVVLRINLGQRPGSGPADGETHYAGRMAVERAAALRVKLTLENNARAPDHLLSHVRDTLGTFSCRFFGTNIDFANYATTGQDPIAAIRGLARWINFIHAKDARKTAAGWESTYLGNGTLPLKEIIAALDSAGRAVPFCFEYPGEGDPEGGIRKSLAFLAKLDA